MALETLALLATLLAAPANSPGYYDGGRNLATRMPYAAGQADSVHRPGFNGREWLSRSVVGNGDDAFARDWNSPGPSAYGAAEDDRSLVYARVGELIVAFSPWEAQQTFGLQHLENARQTWLKEHGYVGGVRTFTNDAKGSEKQANALPQPRATIQVNPEIPKFRSRMQVQRTPMKSDSIIMVSTRTVAAKQ